MSSLLDFRRDATDYGFIPTSHMDFNHLLTSCLCETESSNETAFSSVATVFDKCVSGAQIMQLVVTITSKKTSLGVDEVRAGWLSDLQWEITWFRM